MEDAAFCDHEEGVVVAGNGIFQQGSGGAHHVGQFHDGTFAFRMHEHFGTGVFFLQFHEFFNGKALVDMAGTIPEQHAAPRDTVDVSA